MLNNYFAANIPGMDPVTFTTFAAARIACHNATLAGHPGGRVHWALEMEDGSILDAGPVDECCLDFVKPRGRAFVSDIPRDHDSIHIEWDTQAGTIHAHSTEGLPINPATLLSTLRGLYEVAE